MKDRHNLCSTLFSFHAGNYVGKYDPVQLDIAMISCYTIVGHKIILKNKVQCYENETYEKVAIEFHFD